MKNKKSKVKLLASAVAGLVIASTFCLTACNSSADTSASLSSEEFYGVGSVTTVKLLGNTLNASAVNALTSVTEEVLPETSESAETSSDTSPDVSVDSSDSTVIDEVVDEAEKFNRYFSALDSFLGDETISVERVENTDEEFAQYSTKLIINGKNIKGESQVFVLYFNENLTDTKVEADDDEEETTAKYDLEGVMVFDGETYCLKGVRITESESDENEEVMKICAYKESDPFTYVEMVQKLSVEEGEKEIEYVYRIFKDGKLIEETAVEFENETENGKVKTEFEIKFKADNKISAYSIERKVTDGKTEIDVKYNVDGKAGKFSISEILGEDGESYEYKFSEKVKKSFKKAHKDFGKDNKDFKDYVENINSAIRH
ncbi:MAG: hypothetical protein ACI4M6_01880 [Christensenellaceae bacterium]